jgi:hypothetical protein
MGGGNGVNSVVRPVGRVVYLIVNPSVGVWEGWTELFIHGLGSKQTNSCPSYGGEGGGGWIHSCSLLGGGRRMKVEA